MTHLLELAPESIPSISTREDICSVFIREGFITGNGSIFLVKGQPQVLEHVIPPTEQSVARETLANEAYGLHLPFRMVVQVKNDKRVLWQDPTARAQPGHPLFVGNNIEIVLDRRASETAKFAAYIQENRVHIQKALGWNIANI